MYAIASKSPIHHLVLIAALGMLFTLTACSGSSKVTNPEPEEEPFLIGPYETFNPSDYPDAPPPPEQIQIEHEIPNSLLTFETTKPQLRNPRRTAGYRIQVFSSLDRREADHRVEEIVDWWQNQPKDVFKGLSADIRGISGAPVYMEYEQPHYKVRIGNFLTRRETNEVLAEIQKTFESGFVVQTTVTR